MKFSPLFVTTLAVFALVSSGCGIKSAKQAASDGNKLNREAEAIAQDLAASHKILIVSDVVSDSTIQAYARGFNWSERTESERQAIRTKLNQLAGKIDAIFKIDRRKDVKVSDPSGSLQRARSHADIYLQSLSEFERNRTKKAG